MGERGSDLRHGTADARWTAEAAAARRDTNRKSASAAGRNPASPKTKLASADYGPPATLHGTRRTGSPARPRRTDRLAGGRDTSEPARPTAPATSRGPRDK